MARLVALFLCFALPLAAQQNPSKPESQRLTLKGLQQAVEVLRDDWGVSHIYAKNQHDLFFAQGYIAASDRLFQMELWKRVGQGRLAEVVGKSAVAGDINARKLRYRGSMSAEYASYSPDTQAILKAFTSGINAYIDSVRNDLPIEFRAAGFEPEHWEPEDCLSRNAAFSMTSGAEAETYVAHLVSELGPEKAAALLPLDPPVKLESFPGADYKGLPADLFANFVSSDSRIVFPRESNDWVIAPALSATRRPIVANDPHRAIALPSLRYMVHLVAPGWDVVGSGEPALPGVAIGHNQHVAWGFTIFDIDQKDLFLERLDPRDPLRYKTAGGWKRMRVAHEIVHVKNAPDVRAELLFTEHGPVLWHDPASHRALSVRWVGAEPGTAGYLASLALDRAQSVAEFRTALKRWKLPPENFIYADDAGNIAEQSSGLAPIRTPEWSGLVPAPGHKDFTWRGWRSLDELPHALNPASGYAATANHRIIAEDSSHPVGHLWDPGFRIRRITEYLDQARSSGHKLTFDDMQSLQTDVLSLPARELRELLTAAVKASPQSATPASEMILAWDSRLTTSSAAAELYEVWIRKLTPVVIGAEFPADLRSEAEDYWTPAQTLVFLKRQQDPALLFSTLHHAWTELEQKQGADPKQWAWGELHTVTFRHPLDQTEQGKSWNLGPIARPGDAFTVNSTGGPGFSQTEGASYREIIDVGDWDASLAVNTPGQSGSPASPHYADLLPLWSEGRYFPMLYSRAAIEANTKSHLVLAPK